ncbi:MAG: hypothetical protein CME62_08360 [Halobacteriovoraceae bacterium]|nr:hypothetical protein [Halobacteriovoraceae bacterium]|tara:strand:+ start:756 stop:3599 length:2844 start_codon:yes stop_codon:yes gene_type:complete
MKIFVLFILLTTSLFANDIEKRRNQILQIVDEEISEVSRLMRSTKKNPDLMLRMAELYLEKARLWRERENQRYLNVPIEQRRKTSKSRYFTQSNKYFNQANKLCLDIARNFKNYNRLGEVYYILGFNAKESNNPKRASRYLGIATKKTSDPATRNKTKVTLAEVYYNEKKYKRAIPLYESALDKAVDKWWTKDAFNLAWCYYQVGQKSKAIDLMKKVYSRSENSRFIDMRNDVRRDLGLFYATSGKVDEGVRFYKSIGLDLSDKLIFIAGSLMQQGQFDKAEEVYNEAYKFEKSDQGKIKILIDKLQLYEKATNLGAHQVTSRALYKYAREKQLNSDQLKVFKFQLEKVSAILQRQVIAKTYRRLPKKRQEKAKQAIEYFEYLSQLEPKRADEFKFLKGETAFAAKLNKEAYQYYKEALLVSEKLPGAKFKAKSIEGMLAAISLRENKTTNNAIETFELYLRNWSSGNKAKGIYPRLFNNYMAKNDYAGAKRTLDRYTKNYPKDYKTQEAMIAKLMDEDRKKKNNDNLRAWIAMIDAGKYQVSPKFRTKLKELLTTLQIEDVQQDLNKGNKRNALVGYLAILKDPYSTKRSKINAKYNLSVLYFELDDTKNAYKWSIEAMKEMESKDVVQFADSFITIANYLFMALEFKMSANLSENFIYKICSVKNSKKDISFKNAIFIYLADHDIESARRLHDKASECKIKKSTRELATFELMRAYKDKKMWQEYEKFVEELAKTKNYKAKMIDEYLFLSALAKQFGNAAKETTFRNNARNLYFYAKKRKESVSMDALDYFASYEVLKMKNTAQEVKNIEYAFPEKVFQSRQEQKLKLLEKLTGQASEVQAIGSGVGIVNSFKILHDTYLDVAKDLFAFTPKDKSPEYIQAFKKDMNTLGEQIKQAANQYKKEAKRAIENNEILNTNNFYFQETQYPVRYFGGGNTLIMDRGGKQ